MSEEPRARSRSPHHRARAAAPVRALARDLASRFVQRCRDDPPERPDRRPMRAHGRPRRPALAEDVGAGDRILGARAGPIACSAVNERDGRRGCTNGTVEWFRVRGGPRTAAGGRAGRRVADRGGREPVPVPPVAGHRPARPVPKPEGLAASRLRLEQRVAPSRNAGCRLERSPAPPPRARCAGAGVPLPGGQSKAGYPCLVRVVAGAARSAPAACAALRERTGAAGARPADRSSLHRESIRRACRRRGRCVVERRDRPRRAPSRTGLPGPHAPSPQHARRAALDRRAGRC